MVQCYCVQIADDALGVVVPQENFTVGRLDPNPLIAPDVSAAVADATNSVAAKRVPALYRVFLDLFSRNRAQAKSQGADLDSRGGEEVMEPGPTMDSNGREEQAQED